MGVPADNSLKQYQVKQLSTYFKLTYGTCTVNVFEFFSCFIDTTQAL